jgi:hypothetical protein
MTDYSGRLLSWRVRRPASLLEAQIGQARMASLSNKRHRLWPAYRQLLRMEIVVQEVEKLRRRRRRRRRCKHN